jgi:hypothetical protein
MTKAERSPEALEGEEKRSGAEVYGFA